jgi:signal transduction histidine kinase
MSLFRQLRWKLFLSHMLIVVIGVVVLLATAFFIAGTQLGETPLSVSGVFGVTDTNTPTQNPPPSTSGLENFRIVVEQSLLIAGFAALAAAIVVSLYVSRRIVEPLQELSLVSHRLAQGYYRERTVIQSDDEMADLSSSINQLADALEQTEQRRLTLLADVAHELRTPLTTIEGYMEGLIDGVIEPEPETFAMIQHEATRLKWLIQELALLSRAEAGQLRVDTKPVALQEIIQNVVAQFRPQFAAQDITLNLDLPYIPTIVRADADRIEQVLINLLANGLQYTPSSGIVTIRVTPSDYFVEVSVHDSGIGVPSEHLPHIFERFYRVDKSRARTSGGTGIGLTIARHLVYAHGGEIWAESQGVGHGASFYFTLPVEETERVPA